MNVAGGAPVSGVALIHDTLYVAWFTGGAIAIGDWIVFLRKDTNTDCSSALTRSVSDNQPDDHGVHLLVCAQVAIGLINFKQKTP